MILITNLGGIAIRYLKASSFTSLILCISLSHALGCVLVAAFHIKLFSCLLPNFFLKLLYRWRIQNLCSAPSNRSCMAGSKPCVYTSQLVFILQK